MERIESFARQLYAWAATQRLGRRRYIVTNVESGLIGFSVALAPLFIVFLLPDLRTDAPAFVTTLIAVFAAAGMVAVFVTTSLARLRDMGKHPAWLAAGLVPYVNIAFFVWLAFTEGELAREYRTGRAEESLRQGSSDATGEAGDEEAAPVLSPIS
jgi:hypothetical protein